MGALQLNELTNKVYLKLSKCNLLILNYHMKGDTFLCTHISKYSGAKTLCKVLEDYGVVG